MPPQARASNSWTQIDWSPIPIVRLTSHLPDITDELFSILRFVSEVPDEGKRLVQFHTKLTDDAAVTTLYKQVRAFLRQAENYYHAARTLHYRSSALLYYYCLLNFAEATLSVRGLPYDDLHGLTRRTDPTTTDLGVQAVKVSDKGVFPAFYRQQVKTTLPNAVRLNMKSLLGYVTDVMYQYQIAKLGQPAVFPSCRARLVCHTGNDQAWWTIAVPKPYDFTALPEPNKTTFSNEFEEVDVPAPAARAHFNILAQGLGAYRFHQSKTTLSWSAGFLPKVPVVSLFDSAEGYIEPKYVDDSYDFTLSQPLAHASGPFRMTEQLATYLVMFYLGSLVRYQPDYLDNLLETRWAWIVESFVGTAPLTALRAFVSKITDSVYVFNK